MQTTVVLLLGVWLFEVPIRGSLLDVYLAAVLLIVANLTLGLLISTKAQSQFQAMQMTFFVFLPSILLSGFMFPFAGMPKVVQWIAEVLPLTHFLRLIRGVMLRGASLCELWPDVLALLAFIAVMMTAGDPAVPQAAGLTATCATASHCAKSPGSDRLGRRNAQLGFTISTLLLTLAGSATAADVTVLSAARIHTLDSAQPRVQALAYDDGGRILALGDNGSAAQALSESQTQSTPATPPSSPA